MIKFDAIDLQRIAVSVLGALALSAASMLAAVGPVRAASFDQSSARQIDRQHSATDAGSRAAAR